MIIKVQTYSVLGSTHSGLKTLAHLLFTITKEWSSSTLSGIERKEDM